MTFVITLAKYNLSFNLEIQIVLETTVPKHLVIYRFEFVKHLFLFDRLLILLFTANG